MANTGQIVKSKSAQQFVTIANDIARSTDLSLKAKGLLLHLLSLPHDWVVYKGNLYNTVNDKKGGIDSAFKELQDKGFIVSVKVIDDKGRFSGWNHVVYDNPTENENNRHREIPTSDFTDFGKNAPIQKKDVLTNKDIIQRKRNIQKPTISEVEDYFIQKGSTVEKAKQAFEYYDTADWHDSKGKPVKNWKQKMLAVWLNNQNFKGKEQKTKIDYYQELRNKVLNNL